MTSWPCLTMTSLHDSMHQVLVPLHYSVTSIWRALLTKPSKQGRCTRFPPETCYSNISHSKLSDLDEQDLLFVLNRYWSIFGVSRIKYGEGKAEKGKDWIIMLKTRLFLQQFYPKSLLRTRCWSPAMKIVLSLLSSIWPLSGYPQFSLSRKEIVTVMCSWTSDNCINKSFSSPLPHSFPIPSNTLSAWICVLWNNMITSFTN